MSHLIKSLCVHRLTLFGLSWALVLCVIPFGNCHSSNMLTDCCLLCTKSPEYTWANWACSDRLPPNSDLGLVSCHLICHTYRLGASSIHLPWQSLVDLQWMLHSPDTGKWSDGYWFLSLSLTERGCVWCEVNGPESPSCGRNETKSFLCREGRKTKCFGA